MAAQRTVAPSLSAGAGEAKADLESTIVALLEHAKRHGVEAMADYDDCEEEVDQLIAAVRSEEQAKAEQDRIELMNIDSLLARRPALDERSRYDNIAKAIRVAGESSEALVGEQRKCGRLTAQLTEAQQQIERLNKEQMSDLNPAWQRGYETAAKEVAICDHCDGPLTCDSMLREALAGEKHLCAQALAERDALAAENTRLRRPTKRPLLE